MYKWYGKAATCYAYLVDVPNPATTDETLLDSRFANSCWFRRGWTLQELIAPRQTKTKPQQGPVTSNVKFFSESWAQLDTKLSEFTLWDRISIITGVDVDILNGTKTLEQTSVAKKMSWASHRTTEREEDVAYCLMGLFNVNMPMLYGEGEEKAFFRLQEKIMKESDDQSLFAWRRPAESSKTQYDGMLAKHPVAFARSTNIASYYRDREEREPYFMSNRGLRIDLHLSPYEDDVVMAALECPSPGSGDRFVAIYLKCISYQSHIYTRIQSHLFGEIPVHHVLHGGKETVYIRQQVIEPSSQDIYPTHVIELAERPAPNYKLVDMVVHSDWNAGLDACDIRASERGVLKRSAPMELNTAGGPGWIPSRFPFAFHMAKATTQMAVALKLERTDGEKLVIVLGSTADYNIGFGVLVVPKDKDFPDSDGSYLSPEPLMNGGYMIENDGISMIEHGAKSVVEGDHEIRIQVAARVFRSAVKYYVVDVVVKPVTAIKDPPSMLSGNPPDPPQNARRGFGSLIPKLSRAQPR